MTTYLSCGHYRGRIQTTTMRKFDNLADAWDWACQQDTVGNEWLCARIWVLWENVEPELLKPKDIQARLGLPITITRWL